MSTDRPAEITQLLLDWRGGSERAFEELLPLVYGELRRIARNYMRRQNPGHTLQTTALVNEAYMRLVDSNRVNWQDRNHFFAVSAQLMRRILVDFARKKNSQKRGGDHLIVTLDERVENLAETGTDMVALDETLSRLAEFSPRQSRVIELRFFAGLNEQQIAEVLDISARTVRRDWQIARAWLFRELRSDNNK